MKSLRHRLIVAIAVLVVASSLTSTAISYHGAMTEADELFDAKLAHSARVLMGIADATLAREAVGLDSPAQVIDVWRSSAGGSGDALVSRQGHAYETKLAFQVWDDAGHLRLRSDASPDQPLAAREPGFSHQQVDGVQWRVFTLRSPSGLWYQAGENRAIRDELADDIAGGTLLPLIVQLPLLVLLVLLMVNTAFHALARVTRAIELRSVDNLAPIDERDAPSEIGNALLAVNRLLERLASALERERRFSADAAHELRTPLAALRIHVENLRSATSDAQRRESYEAVQRGIERLGRIVEQLLTLNRVEPESASRSLVPLDLLPVLRQVLEELALLSLANQVDLEFEAPDTPVRVRADALLFSLLVRNLVDNAIRYTPRNGRVRVRVAVSADRVALVVEDSGPGIPEEARERVFERFHRELGSDQPGSGLGLAIVRQVARVHAAQVHMDSSPELGGLRVQVCLPRPA